MENKVFYKVSYGGILMESDPVPPGSLPPTWKTTREAAQEVYNQAKEKAEQRFDAIKDLMEELNVDLSNTDNTCLQTTVDGFRFTEEI